MRPLALVSYKRASSSSKRRTKSRDILQVAQTKLAGPHTLHQFDSSKHVYMNLEKTVCYNVAVGKVRIRAPHRGWEEIKFVPADVTGNTFLLHVQNTSDGSMLAVFCNTMDH